MRVLIVDDEPLSRSALVEVLEKREDVDSYDVAEDALGAIEKLQDHNYDAVLLDINMPEMSGLELLARLGKKGRRPIPSVVLVTAHNQHGMEAFEKHAVDYVLKPFSRERLDEALDVAFSRTAGQRMMKSAALLTRIQNLGAQASPRIAVKSKGRIVFIEPAAVVTVHAEGNYTLLQQANSSYLLRESISLLEKKLQDYGFIRIHRSILINSAFVEGIEARLSGDYGLRMRNGQEFTVTRTYKKNLRNLAELWIGTDGLPGD